LKPTTKRCAALGVFVVFAAFSSYALPELIARREALPHTARGVTTPERLDHSLEWLLITGRRSERNFEDDPTPHRNSRIALYRREDSYYVKQTRDFAIRSTTTSKRLPDRAELKRAGGETTCGFVTIPFGLFSLRKGPWRYPGEIGFLISDWNRTDGVIALSEPQVIEKVTFATDGDTTFTKVVVRSSHDKTGSWLHPTRTQTWSYRDSDGCMNLYKPVGPEGLPMDAPPGPYEWDLFLEELGAREVLQEPPMLAISPWEAVASGEELSVKISVEALRLPEALVGNQAVR